MRSVCPDLESTLGVIWPVRKSSKSEGKPKLWFVAFARWEGRRHFVERRAIPWDPAVLHSENANVSRSASTRAARKSRDGCKHAPLTVSSLSFSRAGVLGTRKFCEEDVDERMTNAPLENQSSSTRESRVRVTVQEKGFLLPLPPRVYTFRCLLTEQRLSPITSTSQSH